MSRSKRKNIAVIVKYFYPVTAGIETNILETYSVLVKKGWDVTIHTSKDTLDKKNCLSDEETIRGLKIRRYSHKWYSFFPKINWGKVDVICLHNFNIFPHFYILVCGLFLKISKQKKFSIILTPHGGFTPEWSIFSRISIAIKRFYHYSIGTFLINKGVDAVRAVSEWEKDQIVGRGVSPNLVHVISNGIENEAYLDVDSLVSSQIKRKVKQLGRYIIQIGRIYKIKNYETTIRALSRVSQDVKYLIIGPTQEGRQYLNSLKKLIKELKLEDRVLFLGVIKGIDKYYLIKHAQMMVHMAQWESFCNVVHEGMSQGLICIVADNTALPFLIKDRVNGFCIDTYDDKRLAEKINYALKYKNGKQLQKMANRNKKIGREMSWEKVADNMDVLYNSTFEKSNLQDEKSIYYKGSYLS